MGHSYSALKDFSQAINFYSKVINISPEQTVAYSWRAKCYRKLAIQPDYTDTEKRAFIEKAVKEEGKIEAKANNPDYKLK